MNTDFKILQAPTVEELETKINAMINLGYQCFCRMVIDSGMFYQSMYRP